MVMDPDQSIESIVQNSVATSLSLFFLLSRSTFQLSSFEFTAKMSDSCPLQSTVNCTVGTCPLSCAQVEYVPTLAGNAVYAAAFSLLLIAQLGLGIKYK